MTRPSCMSSEYKTVQSASCAAATIMPSYKFNWYRSARAKPSACVSVVRGTTSHNPRMRCDARRICIQFAENLRLIVLAHSLRTCTLTIPPARNNASDGIAIGASPTRALTTTLVSKNTSVFVIGVAAFEAIPGRNLVTQLFAELLEIVECDLAVHLALDLQPFARGLDDLDLVALGKAE